MFCVGRQIGMVTARGKENNLREEHTTSVYDCAGTKLEVLLFNGLDVVITKG
jgi:hypothetical protein